jgi:orotate phosphoribosyltransferase-like protein
MIDYDSLNFKDDTLSQFLKTLHKNRVIRFVEGSNKLMQPIPYDFRIDRCCTASHMETISEIMADRVIQIEKELNIKIDSILCSLFSGVFIGITVAGILLKKHNRDIKISICRRSYEQKMGKETGTEKFLTSVHQLKNITLIGELGNNVLVFDEMTNTGQTIQELINICTFNGVIPKAAMIIADRILTEIQNGSHVRMYGDIPCYSSITHFEIVNWCKENMQIWESLYEPIYDNQNKFSKEEFVAFQNTLE